MPFLTKEYFNSLRFTNHLTHQMRATESLLILKCVSQLKYQLLL